MKIGTHTLVAATCRRCGELLDGHNFKRHWRNRRDKHPYLDLRCSACMWAKMKAIVRAA